jgi:hypothetical protein
MHNNLKYFIDYPKFNRSILEINNIDNIKPYTIMDKFYKNSECKLGGIKCFTNMEKPIFQ